MSLIVKSKIFILEYLLNVYPLDNVTFQFLDTYGSFFTSFVLSKVFFPIYLKDRALATTVSTATAAEREKNRGGAFSGTSM